MNQLTKQLDLPMRWNVQGSKGNVYSINMIDETFLCDCKAFQYQNGNCKHIKKIIKELDKPSNLC